jgi:hypothetical protein
MRYLIIVLMASALFLIGCSDSFNQEPTVSTTIGESGNPKWHINIACFAYHQSQWPFSGALKYAVDPDPGTPLQEEDMQLVGEWSFGSYTGQAYYFEIDGEDDHDLYYQGFKTSNQQGWPDSTTQYHVELPGSQGGGDADFYCVFYPN